ncbi:geranylgeranylglycerol-phosphate geranylgeranyltransferase [Fulvivirga lutea]|uniref:Geranylgeranylglycerol-phosphate geranylgeranyltransferase n=1 Tax=Fulvivirga lutea TaxID=2810512 RepID=A0A975A111_9BACT|nr:geranylgeranylglycerol-phosphate geranylgeranyltransferase [Fulvivirga lutea]QSE97806.1 geranylgeranylglycerol-phosphate geranylgeranyltransferase [Fulvivirga lutea]
MSIEYSKPVNFSFSGFIKLTRFWNLVIIVFAQYFTAFFLLENASVITSLNLAILSGSTVIIAAAGYIINDYYDVKIDLINKPQRVVVGRILKRRVAMILHTALNFIGITMGFLLGYKIGLLNFISALLLWSYSNQLKRTVLVGNLVVALLTGLSIYVIAIYFEPNNNYILGYALFAFFMTLIREIIKDLEDLKGDSTFDCRTLPVVHGPRKTKLIIYIISVSLLLSLCSLFYLRIGASMLTMALLLIGPLAYLFLRLRKADTVKEFNYLSNYCKLVMLAGITSMAFFY